MIESLSRIYRYKVYPNVDHIRGSTRLNHYLARLQERSIPSYDGEPENIYEKADWDNLFILDACRYDLFEECYPELEPSKRITLGSSSSHYIEEYYSTDNYDDVVYISANPHLNKNIFEELTNRKPKNVFHAVFHTYKTDWNNEKGRAETEAVIRDFRTARKLFPDKKIIVHFMRPHHPFPYLQFPGMDQDLNGKYDAGVWSQAELGNISWTEVWNNYKLNLVEIVERCKELDQNIEGKTVLTSDHGNLCGENNLGGHPQHRDLKPLREVPWVEL